jgi:hypothetical protein
MVDCPHRNRIDAIRITVKITLVTVNCAVSTRVNVNRAFPATSIGDTIHESFFDEITGRLHRLAIVKRSPAAAVDRGVLEPEVESSGFVNFGNRSRKYPNASDFGIPSDAYTTHVVFNGTNLACTASSVMVVEQFGEGEVFVVVKIMRALGPLFFRPCQ